LFQSSRLVTAGPSAAAPRAGDRAIGAAVRTALLFASSMAAGLGLAMIVLDDAVLTHLH
jgi:hypothetical protein